MRLSLLSLSLGTLLMFSGCGGSAGPVPDMYHLSGKVTFDGTPVERGTISFQPATANGGHAGYAIITNGTYDTKLEGGKGHAGGSMTIQITSAGPPKDNDEPSPGPFAEWTVTEDLPKADGTKDFDVPKEAAKPKSAAPRRNDA